MAWTIAGTLELRTARVGDHVETHAFLDGQPLALPGATLEALAALTTGRPLDQAETTLLVNAGVLVAEAQAEAPRAPTAATAVSLRPELTFICDQPAQPTPGGAVVATGSAPLSIFIAPRLLGAMNGLSQLLRSAWQQLWRAAIARGTVVPRAEAAALLAEIARAEVARDPTLTAAFTIEEPFRLVPRVPLQGGAIRFPIAGLAIAGDRAWREHGAGARLVPLLDGGTTTQLAIAGALLGDLARGLGADALRARRDAHPELGPLIDAIAAVDGFRPTTEASLVRPDQCPPGTILHLGHATLLANLGGAHVLVDPWLPSASRGDSTPAPSPVDLPPLAAIAITHHHWDHVHAETLLLLDKRVPVYIPAQPTTTTAPVPRTDRLLRYLGFTDIRPLAHGETAAVGDGGAITAAPFSGEDPCELGWAGNTYVLAHAGGAAYVHVDASPDRRGRSTVSTGAVRALRERHGALSPVFATRRQELGSMLDYGWEAMLAPASAWAEPTENCATGAAFLGSLARAAGAKTVVLYSEGGAPWYPHDTNFISVPGLEARAAPYQYLWDSVEAISAEIKAAGAELAIATPYRRFRIGAGQDGAAAPRETQ